MEQDFWLDKWRQGQIRFHQHQINPILETFAKRFKAKTIMVPLCGKTLDMVYLRSLGHKIVGVELSPIACRSFFEENKIPFTEKERPDFILFEGGGISLWCGDFFKLPPKAWENVSAVYDRAALIALPLELRRLYAKEILEKSIRPLEMLLITIEYDEKDMQGPPFTVTSDEVNLLYAGLQQEILHSQMEPFTTSSATIEIKESAYWLEGAK
jgi:thiopurine S-methyltransferase